MAEGALLAVIALVSELLSQPGVVDADTKSYLYLDPLRFLGRSLSIWDPSQGLGTVTHQQIGYLWPMGPFFLVTHLLGVPTWVAERLWVAALLTGAGWGVLFCCRVLRLEGPGRLVAAACFMLTPYTLQYLGRISVILLPWAGLGWMVGLTARAARRGGWRDPALFALVTATVGGINATALLYVGLAPVLWLLSAAFVTKEVRPGQAWAAAWRIGLLSALVSLWWIAGLWVEGAYGIDILRYSETVPAIATTSSANEVLRGLGYWYFYGSGTYGPWMGASVPFTQQLWLLATSYGVPALALVAGSLTRFRFRAFSVALVVVGAVLAVGAHPYDHPSLVGGWLKAFYQANTVGLALRSTDRATPLVLLGLALCLGAGTSALWDRLRARAEAGGRLLLRAPRAQRALLDRLHLPTPSRWPVLGALSVLSVLGLLAAANPALFDGGTLADHYLMEAQAPAALRAAARALNREDPGTRVLAEPGENFAATDQGDTVDPIWPALLDASRPFVTREQIVKGSLATADLLYALDDPVQKDVVDPRGLAPLLRLMSVGDLVVQHDLSYTRYGTPQPSTLTSEFDPTPPGLGSPTGYGPPSPDPSMLPEVNEATLASSPNQPVPSPVEVYPVTDPRPIDRAESVADPVVVDGDATGIAEAADAGLLAGAPTILYAGTLDEHPTLRRQVLGEHPTLVVTDSNKKRPFFWNTLGQNAGATLTASQAQPTVAGNAPLDLFPGLPADSQTVARNVGVASVTASAYGNGIALYPEQQPASALQDDPDTQWLVGGFVVPEGQWWQVTLDHPVTTDQIRLLQPTTTGSPRYLTEVTLTFDGRHPVREHLGPASRDARTGGQVLRFPTRTFTTLRITIDATNQGGTAPVGLSEVRIGDVVDRRELVMPSDLLRAAGRSSLADRLVLVMQRERVEPIPPRQSPETTLDRAFYLPTARTFTLEGTATLATTVPGPELERLLGEVGPSGGVTVEASSTLPGDARDAAPAALSSDPGATTMWSPGFTAASQVGAWLQVDLPHPVTVDHLDLHVVADGMHSVPTKLTVASLSPSGTVLAARTVALPPIADGRRQDSWVPVTVRFPALRGARLRVTVDAVRFERTRDLASGQSVVLPIGIAQVGIAGIHTSPPPARLPGQCLSDLLTIDGRPTLANQPVTIEPCGADDRQGITLGPGWHTLRTALGNLPSTGWSIDQVVLDSAPGGGPEPEPGPSTVRPAPTPPAPRVEVRSSSATSASLVVRDVKGPFWLVLGESVDAGWHAVLADGRSLGRPVLIDGFANGWLVTRATLAAATKAGALRHGVLRVQLTFAPQEWVNAALLASLAVFLACALAAALPGRWRRQLASHWPLRRTRHTARRASSGRASDGPADSVDPPRWWAALGVALAVGLVSAAISRPLVGLCVGVLAGLGGLVPWGRLVLKLASVGTSLGLVVLVVAHQAVDHTSPGGGWPAALPAANDLAWAAICLLMAVVAVEGTPGRRRRGAEAEERPRP
ncbi:alpha-(1-_3)-arabinofuranosyltransferase domain-containing protein [Aciditerrimonas ferrireducens]|uniref:alpha-(1->3)-arabinofuranosyltransferase domain-containing protein n=1 Tax=Aciditerrimonas ferrireducens TaxID=667306 RepID=UPI002006CF4E|nr:alpha-(1->3)-arabinofuranosyltransferase family protein [Aciditerrimonas ferrireducens]MCK4176777.1 alpha-(1->3)-arabinofuranosyltransferase [Aciditerrimonas ferrireducens]